MIRRANKARARLGREKVEDEYEEENAMVTEMISEFDMPQTRLDRAAGGRMRCDATLSGGFGGGERARYRRD